MMINLLTIVNQHTERAGEPPQFRNDDPNIYVGYFANKYGEQWVFLYDRSDQTGTLCGGDIGWGNPELVEDGVVNVTLNEAEKLWLAACWMEATFGKSA